MKSDRLEIDIAGSNKSLLLQETQRVLGEQVGIVQEQQAQATRIIRVALTIGGLLLTGLSIYLSSPLFPTQGLTGIQNLGIFLTIGVFGLYALAGILIVSGKIFASALIVLSPESGGISLLTGNPIARILSFYRRYLLPQPLSGFLLVNEGGQDERMSLRPGVDSEEIQKVLVEEDSEPEIVDRVISYNSGCIQGNEQLIEDNREKLSEIYGIGVLAIAAIALITLLLGTFALTRILVLTEVV